VLRESTSARLAHDLTHRGFSAWALTALLAAFYGCLYFTEALEPAGRALGLGGKWGLYGAMYSFAVASGGFFFLKKYPRSRYQFVRTIVAVATQLSLAFAVPLWLKAAGQPEFYFSYLWPLKLDYLKPDYIFSLPLPYILYSFIGSLLLVPLLAVFFGKRWYCSWVCGCGALANTAGDPFRQLSDKSPIAWRFEKVAIYSVLGACILLTALFFVSFGIKGRSPQLTSFLNTYQHLYGLLIVTWLSGILGVVLYPLKGTRFWCRYFCPMAALLGLVQKVGRFRIRVKDDMCISCGLCSSYCEMGIDVRSYAQQNQSFTRASCVGCGICAEVCPRGVLRLENVARPTSLVQITY
jgi:ferredoxin-type protein NapH